MTTNINIPLSTELLAPGDWPQVSLAIVQFPEPGTPLARALNALLQAKCVSAEVFYSFWSDEALSAYAKELFDMGWPITKHVDDDEDEMFELYANFDADLLDAIGGFIDEQDEHDLVYIEGLIAGEASLAQSEYTLH